MQNKKGFTLVELLAAVVILGILSAVAIPSIMKVISNNRDKLYRQDAKKMVTLAEVGIRNGTYQNLGKGDCILITLNGLNTSELKKAPNGGAYDTQNNFVLVKRIADNGEGMPQYEYYVHLVEKYNNSYRGIEYSKIDNTAEVSDIDVKSFNNDIYKYSFTWGTFNDDNDAKEKITEVAGNDESDNDICGKTNYLCRWDKC